MQSKLKTTETLILLPKCITCIFTITALYCVATLILVWTRKVTTPTQVNIFQINQHVYANGAEEKRGQHIGRFFLFEI